MNRCFICGETIEDTFNNIFDCNVSVCYKCFNKFKIRNDSFSIKNCKGVILYYYNDFFKDVLFMYKGMGDYCLKDVFLLYYKNELKRKYKGYILVLAPSNEESELKRGFCHLEEIFKSLDLKIIKCFKKNAIWKQSDKKLKEREEIQNVIKIDKSMLSGVKKVLIVDDVLTSGSTIKTMISQIPSNIVKKVLVLSSNCQIMANEIV